MLKTLGPLVPHVHPTAFVAGTLVGNVRVGRDSSVWYNCTLRGDVDAIIIGQESNIQDNTVIHCRSKDLGGSSHPTIVGDRVTVGHGAILHACTLRSRSFVGMQACVLDLAVVEEGAMVGAGALVTAGTVVRSGELWVGRPAKKLRDLTDKEHEFIDESALAYVEFAARHKESN